MSYHEFIKLGKFTSMFHNCISDFVQSLCLLTVIIHYVIKLSLLKFPKCLTPLSKDVYTIREFMNLNFTDLFPGLISDIMQNFMPWLIRYCSFQLYFRKYFSEHVIIVKYFRGTIFNDVVSVVSVNNMFLVLSDVRIMLVSCGSMSKSCAATAQATPELPVSADAGPGSVDSSNTVDSNNISDTSELASLIHLIKIIDIVDDNVNVNNVVNRHGLWGTKII